MLTSQVLHQSHQIQLKARRLVDGPFAGDYLSVFKGRGSEFAEVREYVPGDDIRTIDWKVTARLGTPHVKQYIEERELTVMMVADVSESTLFSSNPIAKREVIANFCAALSLNAIRHNNRAGLLVFSDQIEAFVAPAKGRLQTMHMLTELLSPRPRRSSTDLALALRTVRQRMTRRTMCFVISDFFDVDFAKALQALNPLHELIPVCVVDPADRVWPDVGLVTLEDLESGRQMLIDSSDPSFQDHYEQIHDTRRASRRALFRHLGIDSIEIDTGRPFLRPVKQYFQRRARGR